MFSSFFSYILQFSAVVFFKRKLILFSDTIQKEKKLRDSILIGIILFGLVIRLYVCFFTSLPILHRDTFEYVKQANSILSGGYINFFPNGYPFLIAAVKVLFGENVNSVLLIINILFSTCIIYFLYDISYRVFKIGLASLFVALVFAIFPNQINYVRWLITEVPATFFLVAGYFFYYRKKNLIAGISFGIATVIRTEIFFILILVVLINLIKEKKINYKLIFSGMLPILLVGGYCYLKTGNFSLAGHGKTNVLISVTASGSEIDWSIADKYPEINTSSKAIELYISGIKDDPVNYLKRRVSNLWELWGFYPTSADDSRGVMSRIVIGVGNIFLIVFGLLGWWKYRKENEINILIIPFIIVTGLHVFLFSMPRYTYLVEPFLIILAVNIFYNKIIGNSYFRNSF